MRDQLEQKGGTLLATLFLYITMAITPAHEPWVNPLAQYVEEIGLCFEDHLRRNLSLPKATISIGIETNATGHVTAVPVGFAWHSRDGSPYDRRTIDCLVEKIRKRVFLAPAEGGLFFRNDDPAFTLLLVEQEDPSWDDPDTRLGTVIIFLDELPLPLRGWVEGSPFNPEPEVYIPDSRCQKGAPLGMRPTETMRYMTIEGQTLRSIADAYDVSIRDISDWNCLPSDHIFTGREEVYMYFGLRATPFVTPVR